MEDERESYGNTVEGMQYVLKRMLYHFHKLCKEHNITYTVMYGTMIGAVRHGGFVPWDGDVDVFMTREQYGRFCKIAHLLPFFIFFQNKKTDPYYREPHVEAKLRDRYSSYPTYGEVVRHHNSLQIDLFVGDVCPRQKTLYKAQWYIKGGLFKLAGGYGVFQRGLNRLNKSENPYYSSFKRRNNRGLFCDELQAIEEIPFEDIYVYCTKSYHRILTEIYGDYLRIPPLEQQIPHEGIANLTEPCAHPASLQWNEK